MLIRPSYDEEPSSKPSAAAPAAAAPPAPAEPEPARAEPAASEPVADYSNNGADNSAMTGQSGFGGGQVDMGGQGFNGGANQSFDNAPAEDDNYGPINVKEDG